ncbi:MAG: alanine--glyoxylate aminotransferase family protein [Candidatus Gastranaerophilales bacterium]|nr:alanine--glyoxylate aminotransferase family protein [Candidatus Gastranaerophilales bacterium]
MQDKTFLMIPGPTPVPESILLAMAKHPIGHRSSEFSNILKEVYADLKWLFQTKNDVFIFTASGTGAMEAALANLVNQGDKVLSLIIGNFGARWANIAQSRGAVVEKLETELGEVITPEDLKEKLAQDAKKEIKIVTLTHSETSTGAKNDVKALCKIIKDHGAISVVDGVTSVGAMEIKMDEWGIDVLVSGSQKGFMIPPGLAFLAASKKAWEIHEKCLYPSFYFDWKAHKKAFLEDTTPWTPAVNLVFALHEALKIMKKEGLENIFARHKKIALGLRKAIRALGLELFVKDDENASYAITSILPPKGISVPDIRNGFKNDFDIVVANGQNQLKDKIFRMGTLGFISERDLITAVGSLEAVLLKLGYEFEIGSGVKQVIN